MGGETVNIMEMADEVSRSIFSRFGWRITGPTNENFQCVQPEKHQKQRNPSHPVDVVFQYDDPFTNQRHYLLTDLKSYAKGSIQAATTRQALVNLSKAVDCANVSQEWQDKYTNSELNWAVHGLLFVYNHDGEFDTFFNKYLADTKPSSLSLPINSKIFVIGPDRISYLLNILNDIDVERGRGLLPQASSIEFWYPDLVNRVPTNKLGDIARIELLMGPWQVLPYEKIVDNEISKGIYIYYDGKGESPKEFEFLMDFAFKNQLVDKKCDISIRMPSSVGNARQNFEQAQDNIFRHFHSFPEVKNRLNQFKFKPIEIVRTHFSTSEIGMEARNG
jgi:hypothetical protein